MRSCQSSRHGNGGLLTALQPDVRVIELDQEMPSAIGIS